MYSEAKYYLELHDFDEEQAYQSFYEDQQFEADIQLSKEIAKFTYSQPEPQANTLCKCTLFQA